MGMDTDSSDEHCEHAELPIEAVEEGIVRDDSAEQPLKAAAPINVILAGIHKYLRERQPLKTLVEMADSLEDSCTVWRDTQSRKAAESMRVTEDGRER